MEKLRFCFGLAVALGLCACKVGPNYCPPQTPVPNDWCGMQPDAVATRPSGPEIPVQWSASQPANPASQPSIPITEPAVVAWWAELHDPTLDALITRAVDSNLTLRIATARVLQARAQRDIAVAAYWPQVNFRDSYDYSGSSLNVGSKVKTPRGPLIGLPTISAVPGTPPVIEVIPSRIGPFPLGGSRAPSVSVQPGTFNTAGGSTSPFATLSPPSLTPATEIPRQQNLFQAGFDASWELDVFGRITRSVEAATDTLEATKWDRRDVLVSLLSDVALNYVQLRGAQRRLEIAYQNIETQREAVDVTRARFEAGFTGELDVAQAQAQLSTTESQLPVLQTQIRQSIYQLSVLLAMPPCSLLDELRQAEPIPNAPPEVPVGLPSDLLRRRPDVRAAERQLASATAQVGVAVANLFPVFALNGSFGTATSDIRHFFDARSLTWSIGPNMTWPIFQGGALRANVRLQDALQEEALANYELIILTAFQDVENSLVAYLNEKVRYDVLADAVVANQRATDLSTELYSRGLTPFLNVLESQRSLFVSQDALVQSETAAVQDLISLYKALGGGWEPAEPCRIDFRGISGMESHAEMNAVDEAPADSAGADE
jgi:outer membrane protein, multidrug efflux system